MKKLINNIKNYNFKDTYKRFIKFIKNNLLFISFVFFCFLGFALVRLITIGTFINFQAGLFDITIAILLGSLGYLFKSPKKQNRYYLTILIIMAIIEFANAMYYSFFSSFVSVTLVTTLFQASEQGGAVIEKINFLHVIYFLIPIGYYFLVKFLYKKEYIKNIYDDKKRCFLSTLLVGGILLFLNIACLSETNIRSLSQQWNRESIVKRYGIVVYQLNDIVQATKTKINTIFGVEEAVETFLNYYQENPNKVSNNKYSDIFEGYNVIAVHMESIMQFLIDYKINGVEVTPNLNKLVKESMYFNNFYSEVSVGTSSDAEFTFSSSLMPVQTGTVAVSYYDRTFETLQNLLGKNGYYVFSMHGNKASMWNRAKLHESLGYNRFYSQTDYELDELIGLGLSDKSFFKQSESLIKEMYDEQIATGNYKNYMGTLITLSNHTPFKDPYYTEGDNVLDVTYHTGALDDEGNEIIYDYLEGNTIGNYLRSVHYADEALGEFIDYVKTHDEYSKTLFVLYGDHAAQLSKNQFEYLNNYNFETGELYQEDEEGYKNYDYIENELFKKVPLIIFTPNQDNSKIRKTISYPMGMIDVLPTLANMLGIKTTYSLGHDIFEIKNNNTVPFANGNFLTNKVYYHNAQNEFRMLGNNITIDNTYIDERKKYTDNVLELSNDIIVYNLIDKAGNRIGENINDKKSN